MSQPPATIAWRVRCEVNRHQVEKHFEITLTDDDLTFTCQTDRIESETRLDGRYEVRTHLDAEALSAEDAVWVAKDLGRVERAFRYLKIGHLDICPVSVQHPTRVRTYGFLCLLVLHMQWHLRRKLAPLLFEDERPV